MNKLLPTTSLNDAIRRVADGNTGAASVIALLNRERSENIMEYLRSLDKKQIYGEKIYDLFYDECNANLERFIASLS